MSKEKQPSDVVFVRLKDRSSIVHDVDTGVTITGTTIVKCKKAGKIAEAIKHGALDVVTEAEYNEQQPQKKEAPAAKAAADTTDKAAIELGNAKAKVAELQQKAEDAAAAAAKNPKDTKLADAADKAAKAYDEAAAKVAELEKALG